MGTNGVSKSRKERSRDHAREYRARMGDEYRKYIREYQREWRKKNPEKVRASQRKYYDANKHRYKEYHRKSRAKLTIADKERLRCKGYGLTPADVQRMIAEQGGKCGLCGERKPTVIDHCHKSGKVRAILCRPCNTGIGLFRDDAKMIRRALDYLERYDPTDEHRMTEAEKPWGPFCDYCKGLLPCQCGTEYDY